MCAWSNVIRASGQEVIRLPVYSLAVLRKTPFVNDFPFFFSFECVKNNWWFGSCCCDVVKCDLIFIYVIYLQMVVFVIPIVQLLFDRSEEDGGTVGLCRQYRDLFSKCCHFRGLYSPQIVQIAQIAARNTICNEAFNWWNYLTRKCRLF